MKNKHILRNELVGVLKEHLQKSSYSTKTIKRHTQSVRRIYEFMEEKSIKAYTEKIGEQFCNEMEKYPISHWVKEVNRTAVNLLNLIILGIPLTKMYKQPIEYKLWGDFSKEGEIFLDKIKRENRLSDHTNYCYRRYLSIFSKQMFLKNISVYSLEWQHIVDFLSEQEKSVPDYIRIIKRFLRFLADENFMSADIPNMMQRLKFPVREKLPSVYSPKEVLKIESSPKLGTSIGKRDYAIILLASRLGLRASDITALQFRNIDWEQNVINIIQYKTKKPITLPLLNIVGNALIDYILNGRPKSESNFVFLRAIAPYDPITRVGIISIVRDHIQKTGIEIKGRHIGAHVLRHSFATELMSNKVPIEVISESLGHSSIDSTKFYLEVSIPLLRQCAHEVPIVSDDFYNQKGGVFYE